MPLPTGAEWTRPEVLREARAEPDLEQIKQEEDSEFRRQQRALQRVEFTWPTVHVGVDQRPRDRPADRCGANAEEGQIGDVAADTGYLPGAEGPRNRLAGVHELVRWPSFAAFNSAWGSPTYVEGRSNSRSVGSDTTISTGTDLPGCDGRRCPTGIHLIVGASSSRR